jgi:1,4-dihydroxy-6-naphthoate synthase
VAGELAAGVVIHEGQLTWREEGLHALVDLGVWWGEQTGGLPLPLGGNVVRRDLGEEMVQRIARLLRQAIEYALANREAALDHSLRYARGLDRATADRFVGMYVNQRTVDYGERGRQAVRLFLERAHQAGLIPRVPRLDFVTG